LLDFTAMRPTLLALGFALLGSAQAQTAAPPTIKTMSPLVLVDVTVTDAQGNAVHGLKAADFHVFENGAQQTVAHFEEHTVPDGAQASETGKMPTLPPNVYSNFTTAPSDAPLDVLLIDCLNTDMGKQAKLVRQLTEFVEHRNAGSNFAVFELTNGLRLLQGFTADRKLLLGAIGKVAIANSPMLHQVTDEGLGEDVRVPGDQEEFRMGLHRADATQAAEQDRMRVVMTLTAMNQLARYLAAFPAARICFGTRARFR
jgi:VWFA-related protein